jgi:hypothetical protein
MAQAMVVSKERRGIIPDIRYHDLAKVPVGPGIYSHPGEVSIKSRMHVTSPRSTLFTLYVRHFFR